MCLTAAYAVLQLTTAPGGHVKTQKATLKL